MTNEELFGLISEVQHHRSEMVDVEVKSDHKGTPQRLYEAMSAFDNSRPDGVAGITGKTICIDEMFHALYGLTPKEIALVEGKK